MKQKGNKSVSLHLEYLYDLAVRLPYRTLSKSKIRDFVSLSKRHQCKLRKIKKTICRKCGGILIPRATCVSEFIRRENGFGLRVVCLECSEEQFTVIRGK